VLGIVLGTDAIAFAFFARPHRCDGGPLQRTGMVREQSRALNFAYGSRIRPKPAIVYDDEGNGSSCSSRCYDRRTSFTFQHFVAFGLGDFDPTDSLRKS
jgi:hypothetical protein